MTIAGLGAAGGGAAAGRPPSAALFTGAVDGCEMIDPRPLFSGATLTTSFETGRPLENVAVGTAVIPLVRFT